MAGFDSGERLARLRLIRSENVGPITFRQLLGRFGSATAALEALPHLARQGGRSRPVAICPVARAEAELRMARKIGAHPLFWGESDYPTPLAAIEDAPPVLYTMGHRTLLEKPLIAMVGARNASTVGRRIAATLASDLGQAGLVVVSGLARGIDGIAHAASLDSGTIAVLAGGVDVIYPPEHQALYQEIAARGLLLSEMPPGLEPQARHFPRRNRIISGLCRGVLVVEASLKSGSLITAHFALDQGREIFAVPGSPLDPRARGPNKLLRDGAILTESAADILEVLEAMDARRIKEHANSTAPIAPPAAIDEEEVARAREAVLDLLSHSPAPLDSLIRHTDMSTAAVQSAILTLELAGRLERHPGNRVSLLPEAMPALGL